MSSVIIKDFYNRNPLVVAREILGKILVREINNQIVSGRIVEVEAYLASEDEASHSFKGMTKRNISLYKEAGHAYIHSIHRQNCIDIVTEAEGIPTSVLIRSLEPLVGIEIMKINRNKENLKDLTNGPGKLTQALQINKDFDGIDITNINSPLYLKDDNFYPENIISTKRIGISKNIDKNFRFYIKGNLFVSKK